MTAARRQRPGASTRPRLVITLLLGIFPVLLILALRSGLVEDAEWASYDLRLRLRNRIAPRAISPEVQLVAVVKADRELQGEELYNRTSHQRLLERLRAWGAATVVFDIFFEREEPDHDDLLGLRLREVPSVLGYVFNEVPAPTLPGRPGVPELQRWEGMARDSTETLELARAFLNDVPAFARQWEGVLEDLRMGSSGISDPQGLLAAEAGSNLAWGRYLRRLLRERYLFLKAGRPMSAADEDHAFEASGVSVLAPRALHAARGLGFANIEKGHSSVVRQAPMVYAWKDRLFPSLDLAALLTYYGVEFKDVHIDWGREIRFSPRRNGSTIRRIPIDDHGLYLVNFREGESYFARESSSLALTQVIDPSREAERARLQVAHRMKGAVVLVGEVIAGERDTQPIPLQPRFAMVGMHANVIDNILHDDCLVQPPGWALASGMVAFGALVGLGFHLLGFWSATRVTVLLLFAYLAGSQIALQGMNLVLPGARVVAATMCSVILLFGYVVGVKERDRRVVRDVFLKTVSPRIGEEILRNFSDQAIWGSRRVLTTLFIDVRGYTSLSETHSPDVVLQILDHFYDTVSEIVFRHEGQVNKFMGDAVMALFGALPEEAPNHAERAFRAAVECQLAMEAFNDSELLRSLGVRVQTGAGINTGEAIAGLVGRRRIRIEFTAIGDVVNIASRLQAKATSGQVALGEATVQLLGGPNSPVFAETGVHLTEVEAMQVKGKALPLKVFLADLAPGRGLHQDS